jgi:uncharacterized repeat protein (TIGR02543 family)
MGAPSGTVWGTIVSNGTTTARKVGVYVAVSSTDTQTKVSAEVWYASIYSWNGYGNVYYSVDKTPVTSYSVVSNKNISHTNNSTAWSSNNQTKVYTPSTITYNRGTSAVTHTIRAQFGDSSPSTVSVNFTVPALPSYTVTYNANGGTGAPSSQTKYYGQSLTLSSTKPTRAGYNFLGWSTSSSATSATYSAGGSYTNNSVLVLYAVWEVSYRAPRISSVTANRVDSGGNISDTGTKASVTFTWATDNSNPTAKIEYKKSADTSWTSSTSSTMSGTSGTNTLDTGSATLDTESSYDIRLTVTDSGGSTTALSSIGSKEYIIDFLAGGKGVAIGGSASKEGFNVAWDADFDGAVNIDGTTTIKGNVYFDASSGVTSATGSLLTINSSTGKVGRRTVSQVRSSMGLNLQILYGTVSYNFKTSATSATVNFSTATNYSSAFTNTPVVICQQVFDSVNTVIKTENVTTTSFKMETPALGSSGTRNIMWIAIAKI